MKVHIVVHVGGDIGNAYLHLEDAVKEVEKNLANDYITFIRTRELQE